MKKIFLFLSLAFFSSSTLAMKRKRELDCQESHLYLEKFWKKHPCFKGLSVKELADPKLITKSSFNIETPLIDAVKDRNGGLVVALVAAGAPVNLSAKNPKETSKQSALNCAAYRGYDDLVGFLLDSGAEIEFGDQTPLFQASSQGHLPVVKLLVEREAQVDAQDVLGMTPFFASVRNCHLGVARFLLDSGANVNSTDTAGRTPLDHVIQLNYVEQGQWDKFPESLAFLRRNRALMSNQLNAPAAQD